MALPLHSIRIADFSWVWAGPYCTNILAAWGAEVIKVESPRRADVTRTLAPFAYADPATQEAFLEWVSVPWMDRGPAPCDPPSVNQAGYFNSINHNKLSTAIDLAKPQGVALAKRLVAISDIVVENFSTRVMRGFGLDYEALRQVKPDIVYISLSAAGQEGPYRDHVFYGAPQVSLSGLASLTGYEGGPPMPVAVSYGDPVAGLYGAFAILAALRHRKATGHGQYVDLSQWEAVMAQLPEGLLGYAFNGRIRPRMGNHDDVMAPHNVYPCDGEDSWVSIAVGSEREWRALCAATGHPEWERDPRFADAFLRHRNQDALDSLLADWTRGRTAEDVTEMLQRAGVAATPSYTNEGVCNHPHLNDRRFFVTSDHPETGQHRHAHTQFMINESRGAGRRAPLLGEHTEQVLCSLLGVTPEELERLRAEKVVS